MKILLCLLLLLPGCYYDIPANNDQKTFDEITQPYLDKYGVQEETVLFNDDDYEYVEWHWWTQGFSITFVHNTVIEVYGWYVQYTEKYCPI